MQPQDTRLADQRLKGGAARRVKIELLVACLRRADDATLIKLERLLKSAGLLLQESEAIEQRQFAEIKRTFYRFSESFSPGTTAETLIAGYKAAKKFNKDLTAKSFLGME